MLDPRLISEFILKTEKAKLATGRADLADGAARANELLFSFAPIAMGFSAKQYLGQLTSRLEQLIQAAREDLANAVLVGPVHGEFASLWYGNLEFCSLDVANQFCSLIVERLNADILMLADQDENGAVKQKCIWDGIPQRLVCCCKDIWTIVEDVLCNDSPEGGLLADSADDIDTKELLSFSFRAIHESR